MSWRVRIALSLAVGIISALSVFPQTDNSIDPLVRLLEAKGVLTSAEARTITENASKDQRDRLAVLLREKGVISSAEFDSIQAPALKTITADYKTPEPATPSARPQASPPTVIAAIAPVRLLGIDMPKREGLIPDV